MNFTSISESHHLDAIVKVIKWFPNYEEVLLNKSHIIDDIKYHIVDIQRNRCTGFFFGTDEEWQQRDLYLKCVMFIYYPVFFI